MSLIDFCKTDKEIEYVTAYEEKDGATFVDVAKLFDKDPSTVRQCINRVKNRASIQGYSPEHDMKQLVPDTHLLKGTSTLYGDDGNIKLQWVKTNIKQEALMESLKAIVEGMKDEIVPVVPTPLSDEKLNSDLMAMYTIADSHLGMLAWHEEGGDNYNLDIAEERLMRWFDYLVDKSPNSTYCVINSLGDLLHTDSYRPETPTSGHLLDADSRFPEIVRAAVRVIRYVVARSLDKHDFVRIVFSMGNHDMSSTVWLRELFGTLYENEPRVHVDDDPRPYACIEFGNVMLGFHHGHIKKAAQLPLLFATEFSKVWGTTNHRYAHVGHRHHLEIKEHSGMIIEQHSTMSARDAYASWGGWHSKQKATAIIYHREFGEVGRTTVTPEML